MRFYLNMDGNKDVFINKFVNGKTINLNSFYDNKKHYIKGNSYFILKTIF